MAARNRRREKFSFRVEIEENNRTGCNWTGIFSNGLNRKLQFPSETVQFR